MNGGSNPRPFEGPARPILYLLYHELRPFPCNYSYAVETAVFEQHVGICEHLRKNLSPGAIAEFTFDDGYTSDFEFALPILSLRGIRARFFITVGWTGKKAGYMDWRQVRCLCDGGHIIGAHGWSHNLLTHCSRRELDLELRASRSLLEDKLGMSITTMSLPGGRYNPRILAACHEAGYTRVYTSVPQLEMPESGFMVGRVNVSAGCSAEWLQQLLQPESRELSRLKRQYRIKAAAKAILGDARYEKVWAAVTRKEPDIKLANPK